MYNYLDSSCGTVFITILVCTSGCKLIKISKLPIDLISFEGCINEGFILTCSSSSKIFEISVGLTEP